MKKYFSYSCFFLICLIFIISNPKADSCSYKDQQALNKEASNIKFNYELVNNKSEIANLPEDTSYSLNDYYYLQIIITNLSENFYIEITNNQDNNKQTYHYSDVVDNIITLKKDYNAVVKYTMTVYGNNTCQGKKIYVKNLTVPRFNIFYKNGYCQSMPDYKYCQELISTNLSDEKVAEKISTYYHETVNKQEETQKDNKLIKYLIITGITILSLGIIFIIIYIIKKLLKRRRIK